MIAALLALALAPAPQIGIRELLPEMSDMERLAYRPDPWYTCAQASSYDRKAKSPTQDWFANWDAGKYLRVETREGRKERVMADLKGPGAVVRIWSANPAGVMRFYFDGEANPRLMAPAGDLLSGKVKPFGDPFAYVSSAGWNLYYPLPYAKSLKITVDDTDGDKSAGMYYHVGYRTYGPSTAYASAIAVVNSGFALMLLEPPPVRTPGAPSVPSRRRRRQCRVGVRRGSGCGRRTRSRRAPRAGCRRARSPSRSSGCPCGERAGDRDRSPR